MLNFNIVTVRIFLAVAREGSIGAAARREHIAASAVSRRISELEHNLNVTLIHRKPSGVSLTPAGKAFTRHCEGILERFADARAELNRFASGEVGELRIAAVTSVICGRLPDIIASFRETYPEVKVSLTEINSASGLRYLREDLADLAIIGDTAVISGFESRLYSYDPVWVITPLGHPLLADNKDSKPVNFSATLEYQHISLNEGGDLNKLIANALKKADHSARHDIHVTRIGSLKHCVRAGLGLGFLRQSAAISNIEKDGILGAPLADEWAMRRILCVYSKPYHSSPLITRFLDLLEN